MQPDASAVTTDCSDDAHAMVTGPASGRHRAEQSMLEYSLKLAFPWTTCWQVSWAMR